jgi:serine/threonine protein kinase
VLLGDDGRPRLVDFGLAMPVASADLAGVSGTLPYMAPEQARGEVERIDPRTDVFGLGAVLYELLIGRPPHQGSTHEELWRGRPVPATWCRPGSSTRACLVRPATCAFAAWPGTRPSASLGRRVGRGRPPLAAATEIAVLVTQAEADNREPWLCCALRGMGKPWW